MFSLKAFQKQDSVTGFEVLDYEISVLILHITAAGSFLRPNCVTNCLVTTFKCPFLYCLS